MTIFFIFMAIGILILGPMSDKYGRKPVLIASISISLIFSAACAFAPNITLLILARGASAFGAGGMVAISTALIRDSYEGKAMSKVLSVTQAFMLIAPMLAPVLGALILEVADWKMTFIVLAALTGVSLAGAFLLQETLPVKERTQSSTLQSILGLRKVAKNPNFSSLLLVGAIIAAPFMAYLALASYIYIDGFGVSETTFSMYFALNAAASILGPVMYMRFGAGSVKKAINAGIIVSIISAVLILTSRRCRSNHFLIVLCPLLCCDVLFPTVDFRFIIIRNEDRCRSSIFCDEFRIYGYRKYRYGCRFLRMEQLYRRIRDYHANLYFLSILVWLYLLKAKSIKFDWK